MTTDTLTRTTRARIWFNGSGFTAWMPADRADAALEVLGYTFVEEQVNIVFGVEGRSQTYVLNQNGQQSFAHVVRSN